MKRFTKLLAGFLIIAPHFVIWGQNMPNKFVEKVPLEESKGELCEYNNVSMDAIAMMLLMDKNALLYVIAHGGTNESQSVVKRRLDYTKIILLGVKRFDKKRMVFATGDKIKGKGTLDFYVGSQLFLTISMQKNRPVCYLTPDYCGRKNELCR